MYQDSYSECNVPVKTLPLAKVFSALMVVLSAFTLLAGLLFLNPIWLLSFLVLVFLTYLQMMNSHLEYEYIFVSGDMQIDVIKWQRKRKKVMDFSLDNVTVIAKNGSDAARAYSGRSLKVRNFTSHTTDDYYILALKTDGEEQVVLFEPDEDMLDVLSHAAPSKVKR